MKKQANEPLVYRCWLSRRSTNVKVKLEDCEVTSSDDRGTVDDYDDQEPRGMSPRRSKSREKDMTYDKLVIVIITPPTIPALP